MFRQHVHFFFNALTFYSRFPGPKWVEYSAQHLNRGSAYFPLIGLLVALFGYIFFYISSTLFNEPISIFIFLISTILATGAFHEDGFADSCDGFGGGWTQTDILKIMKDSRLGTYGVIGLISLLGLKYVTLLELTGDNLLISVICAHTVSRVFSISLVRTLPYVQQDNDSKSKPIAKRLPNSTLIIAWVIGLAPLVWLPLSLSILIMSLCSLLFIWIHLWFKQRIQGYTGDALGASQQIHEVAIYLTILAYGLY